MNEMHQTADGTWHYGTSLPERCIECHPELLDPVVIARPRREE